MGQISKFSTLSLSGPINTLSQFSVSKKTYISFGKKNIFDGRIDMLLKHKESFYYFLGIYFKNVSFNDFDMLIFGLRDNL